MSYLAIGAVTKAIAELLARKMNKPPLLGSVVPKVTTLPPDDERVGDGDGVNLFLYRVAESTFHRNAEWRGNRSQPSRGGRAPLSLTLHYLLTVYAKRGDATAQDDVTAHQLLGNAMTILHEHPVLNDVHDADFDAALDSQFAAELRDSFEKIKVTLSPASVEDVSKLWTGLNKAYRLSVFYDVALVQLAPTVAPHAPAPPVLQTVLELSALAAPEITSLTPEAGPAGARVTLKGSHFKTPGRRTVVTVNDVAVDETELARLTPDEIELTIPEAPRQGPRLLIKVAAGGRESAPATYRVEPWINSVAPLRGIGGIPLLIPFEAPPGANVGAEFDGQKVTAAYDARAKAVRVVVPEDVAANGPKTIVLLVEGRRSNALFYEVLPQLDAVKVTREASPARTLIELTGRRLSGKDVQARYGRLLIRKGENSDSSRLGVEVARLLPEGEEVVAVVDGRESNTLPPSLESADPLEVRRGEPLTLNGRGLSGKSVVVKFGAIDLDLGAHAYATRLAFTVPTGAPAGETQVKVNVNGMETNAVTCRVLA